MRMVWDLESESTGTRSLGSVASQIKIATRLSDSGPERWQAAIFGGRLAVGEKGLNDNLCDRTVKTNFVWNLTTKVLTHDR